MIFSLIVTKSSKRDHLEWPWVAVNMVSSGTYVSFVDLSLENKTWHFNDLISLSQLFVVITAVGSPGPVIHALFALEKLS